MAVAETLKCPTCRHDVPAGAKFCTTCEQWIEDTALRRRERRVAAFNTLATSLALPLGLFIASAVLDCGAKRRADAEEALQRESAVLESLSEALRKITEVSDRFIDASHAIEDACRIDALASGTSEGARCARNVTDGLRKFDHLLAQLSWALDMVPVSEDTYRRANRVKERYYLSCRNKDGEELCGYRQALVRRSQVDDDKLQHCGRGDEQRCNEAIEAIKSELLRPFQHDMNALLCALTRDASALRQATWKSLSAVDGKTSKGLQYEELARRLLDNAEISRCLDILRRPVPRGNGLAGPTPFKRSEI